MTNRKRLLKNKGPQGCMVYVIVILVVAVTTTIIMGHMVNEKRHQHVVHKRSPRTREWMAKKAQEKKLFEQELARLAMNTEEPLAPGDVKRRKWKIRPEEIMNTIYIDRKNVLSEQCSSDHVSSNIFNSSMFVSHFQYLSKYRLAFCSAEKVASTFWRRLLQQVNRGVVQSPYWIRPEHVMDQQKTFADLQYEEIKDILSTFTTFLFVRDPYARLWSGYVDKIFSPNSVYWATYGVQIVKSFRSNSSQTSQRCGHDVTFKEFIKFIINQWKDGKLTDPHFVPISNICDPCSVNFDLIGHLETFSTDTEFILKAFHLDDYWTVIKSSDISTIDDAIYDTVQAYFSMKTYVEFCISEDEALRRVWRKMVYRGIISSNFAPPENISVAQQEIIDALTEAHQRSLNNGLREQKRKLMTLEYQSVPIDDLKKLSKIYMADFKYFGYNPYPYSLFHRENTEEK